MITDADDELTRLRAENARLEGLLDGHGITWGAPDLVHVPVSATPLSTNEKVTLFRRLFRGHADVYPVAGRARPARPAIHQRAPTNGGQASAKSRASSAPIAETGSWSR
jgi:hypothetical protein